MANAHREEQQMYDQIKREGIKVPLHIWDLLYSHIGDDVTAIAQIVSSYCMYNEPISVDDAKKIIEHTTKIRTVLNKILHPEKIEFDEGFNGLESLKKNDSQLHPVVKELLTHYINNDIHGINMVTDFYLDPIDECPVPVESAQKILDKTYTIKQFMDRLSAATNQEIKLITKLIGKE
jgi:hypothetical protein